MQFDIERLGIPDLLLIRPKRYADFRGYFAETYNQEAFAKMGIDAVFVQDNHSLSLKAGTIRGLHFQSAPFEQGKLVRVVRGRIFDVAVDIRRSSASFGRYVSVELSAQEGDQIMIPAGFAHGFCALEPDTEVVYKVDQYYSVSHDRGIRWDDPRIGINWPLGGQAATLSEKDKNLPLLADGQIF
jgi:dTDP-4-dehydrorhamnose 3,5-epimerase